jgi:hypothetical protein
VHGGLRIAGFAVLGVIGAAVFALVFGWLVMLLWNWLMPVIFGLGTLTYWQSFGIVILAKLIFGAVGGRHHGRGFRPGGGPWDEHWKGGRERWRWYGDFWRDEGREAFERYVQKKRDGEEKPATS